MNRECSQFVELSQKLTVVCSEYEIIKIPLYYSWLLPGPQVFDEEVNSARILWTIFIYITHIVLKMKCAHGNKNTLN